MVLYNTTVVYKNVEEATRIVRLEGGGMSDPVLDQICYGKQIHVLSSGDGNLSERDKVDEDFWHKTNSTYLPESCALSAVLELYARHVISFASFNASAMVLIIRQSLILALGNNPRFTPELNLQVLNE
jgi:hypothetical protein